MRLSMLSLVFFSFDAIRFNGAGVWIVPFAGCVASNALAAAFQRNRGAFHFDIAVFAEAIAPAADEVAIAQIHFQRFSPPHFCDLLNFGDVERGLYGFVAELSF